MNGYGVIGKRVADAIAQQDDMDLAGVVDIAPDYLVRVAAERGYAIYAGSAAGHADMAAAGLPVSGSLDDLIRQVDVVIDCTPKRVGATNRERYRAAGVRSIWQGGETHELAGYSFVAQVNYAGAMQRESARIVSCNTTALCRVTHALRMRGWVKRVRAVLFRRATDVWESHKTGMINTAMPEMRVPSHQGPDAQTVMADLDITTLAAAAPFNLGHLHYAMVETTRAVDVEEVRMALSAAPRIAFVRGGDGVAAMNSVVELMRDLRRPRADMWEVAVWEDAIASDGRDIYLTYQVDNEAIVIPENVDCVRALAGLERSASASMAKTDASLGVTKEFLTARPAEVRDVAPQLSHSGHPYV